MRERSSPVRGRLLHTPARNRGGVGQNRISVVLANERAVRSLVTMGSLAAWAQARDHIRVDGARLTPDQVDMIVESTVAAVLDHLATWERQGTRERLTRQREARWRPWRWVWRSWPWSPWDR